MVPHQNQIVAFQQMLRECGLTNTNGYNNANRNNETEPKSRDYTGATLTGQSNKNGEIGRFQTC